MIGIRADESYNRFVAIASLNKQRFADDKPWTTAAPGGHSWYIYPIYGISEKTFYNYINAAASPRVLEKKEAVQLSLFG